MIKKVYNYSNGEKEATTMSLRDLFAAINRQWVKLRVLHPSKDGVGTDSAKVYEGDVADEAFVESIGRFMDCPVCNVAAGSENGKPSLHITVHCDKYIPFDLNEHLNEFSDDFLTKYN